MSITHPETPNLGIDALDIFPTEIWCIILFDVFDENNSAVFIYSVRIAMALRHTCKLFAGIGAFFIQNINDTRKRVFENVNLKTFFPSYQPTNYCGRDFLDRTIQTVSSQTGWIAAFYLPRRYGKTQTIVFLALLYALLYSNKKVVIVKKGPKGAKRVFESILNMAKNAYIKVDQTDFNSKLKLVLPNRSTIEVLVDWKVSFFKKQIQDKRDLPSIDLLLLDDPHFLDKHWRIPRETNSKTIVSFGTFDIDPPDLVRITKSPWPNDIWQTKQYLYNCFVVKRFAAFALSVAVQNNGCAKFYVYKK